VVSSSLQFFCFAMYKLWAKKLICLVSVLDTLVQVEFLTRWPILPPFEAHEWYVKKKTHISALVIYELRYYLSTHTHVLARCITPSTHTTTWNTCCHNTALLITMYLYWLFLQKCNFSQAQCKLPEDGPNGPKHVGANIRYFNVNFNILYVQ